MGTTPQVIGWEQVHGALTARFDIGVVTKPEYGVVGWLDGPSVRSATIALKQAGFVLETQPGERGRPAPALSGAVIRDGQSVVFGREIRLTTAVLAWLRDGRSNRQAVAEAVIDTDFPSAGLSGRSQVEQDAITMVAGRLPVRQVRAMADLDKIGTAVTMLGGSAAILQATARDIARHRILTTLPL